MNRKIHLLLILLVCSLTIFGQNREIWEIQGNGPTSPFLNQTVTTSDNIVTVVFNNLIFIQTPDDRADGDETTSNGLLVNINSGANIEVGNRISLTGQVIEIDGMTQISSSGLGINSIDNSNSPLPSVVELNGDFPSKIPTTIPELEQVEGMLVNLPQAITTASSGFDGNTSIVAGTLRTFREPGIPFPGSFGLPVWDDNPERFEFRPAALGQPNLTDLPGGTSLNANGIINQDDNDYEFWPITYQIEFLPPPAPVRERINNEITVASLNMLTLFDNEPEFEDRLQKFGLFITEQLRSPDIIAVQEVESLEVLNELIDKIESLDPELDYTAFISVSNSGDFPINLGYLVRPNLNNVSITPLGTNESLSIGGTLHDRPPLLLEGNYATSPPTPIKILNIHNRSLNGITGNNSNFVRTKRHEQAVSVARMARSLQDENLIILGDFNAFEFSDGYVDVYNQIAGTPSLGAQFEIEPILENPLVTYIDLLPESERYSFVFSDNAQLLDHVLSTELEGFTVTGLEYARGNADYPTFYFDDPNTTLRNSDHDAPVLFLELDSVLGTPELPFESEGILSFPNPLTINDPIAINLSTGADQQLLLYQMDGKLIAEADLGFTERGETIIQNPFSVDVSGWYILRLKGFEVDVSSFVLFIKE